MRWCCAERAVCVEYRVKGRLKKVSHGLSFLRDGLRQMADGFGHFVEHFIGVDIGYPMRIGRFAVVPHQSTTQAPMVSSLWVSTATWHSRPLKNSGNTA